MESPFNGIFRFLRQNIKLYISGLNLAVFRGDTGDAHIVDAYCPHMGANLGVGGRVEGDCIECPFHGWKFRGYDGQCTEIPYAEKGLYFFFINSEPPHQQAPCTTIIFIVSF